VEGRVVAAPDQRMPHAKGDAQKSRFLTNRAAGRLIRSAVYRCPRCPKGRPSPNCLQLGVG
jgi:hypothetical protein